MKKPDEPNPNATIQLDSMKSDDVQLVDNDAADAPEDLPGDEPSRPKTAPPPLPPEASLPPPAPVVHPTASLPPPKKPRNPLVIGALFAVLLVVAITVGVKVGHALRGQPPVASAAPSASAPTAAQPHATITMPTIEMMDEPDAH